MRRIHHRAGIGLLWRGMILFRERTEALERIRRGAATAAVARAAFERGDGKCAVLRPGIVKTRRRGRKE